jgi:hypothetical protein
MTSAWAGGENYSESKNNTSILTVAEDDCFPRFSRSELVFIELPALTAQNLESLAAVRGMLHNAIIVIMIL